MNKVRLEPRNSQRHSLTLLPMLALMLACGGTPSGQTTPPVITPQRTTVQVGMNAMELFIDPGTSAREIAASQNAIWEVLTGVHETLSIPVTINDVAGHQMGNDGYRASHLEGNPLSQYIDCGRGRGAQNADQYRVTLFVITRLSVGEGGGTLVETTVTGTASPRDVRGNGVNCSSRGRLELRMAQLIQEALPG